MPDIVGERVALAAQGLRMRTREQWGARFDYTNDRPVEMPARWFFLHVAVVRKSTMDATVRVVENIGISRFPATGFSYNAAVWTDGTLLEGQPLTRRGAHTVNDRRIAGFPTNLNVAGRALVLPQMDTDPVSDEQIRSAARWAAAQKRAGLARRDARWYGHRDFALKSCPGNPGYARLGELNALTEFFTANGLVAGGDDEMSQAGEQAILQQLAEIRRQLAVLLGARPAVAEVGEVSVGVQADRALVDDFAAARVEIGELRRQLAVLLGAQPPAADAGERAIAEQLSSGS